MILFSSPTRMMDLFSGAGGLSIGLEGSGTAVARWAVESCPHAAAAFKLNHPRAEVKIVMMMRCDGSLVAHQTSGAEVPGSNPAFSTMILMRCMQDHCAII